MLLTIMNVLYKQTMNITEIEQVRQNFLPHKYQIDWRIINYSISTITPCWHCLSICLFTNLYMTACIIRLNREHMTLKIYFRNFD
jgi:hypothetical protein